MNKQVNERISRWTQPDLGQMVIMKGVMQNNARGLSPWRMNRFNFMKGETKGKIKINSWEIYKVLFYWSMMVRTIFYVFTFSTFASIVHFPRISCFWSLSIFIKQISAKPFKHICPPWPSVSQKQVSRSFWSALCPS